MSNVSTRPLPGAALVAVPATCWGLLIGVNIVLYAVHERIAPGVNGLAMTVVAVATLVAFKVHSDRRLTSELTSIHANQQATQEAIRAEMRALQETINRNRKTEITGMSILRREIADKGLVRACCAPTMQLPTVMARVAIPAARLAAPTRQVNGVDPDVIDIANRLRDRVNGS